MAYIYKFTFPNKKTYIGFTNQNKVEDRWYEHKISSTRSGKKTKLYAAIKKYGFDNIVKEIIYENEDAEYTLNVMEPFFIKENNSITNGYNMCPGGNKGPVKHGKNNGTYALRKNKKMNEWFTEEQIIKWKKSMSSSHGGENNVHARKLLLTSPEGIEYIVHGKLKLFCNNKNISFSVLYDCLVKGITIVPSISSKSRFKNGKEQKQRRMNTTGWSIRSFNESFLSG